MVCMGCSVLIVIVWLSLLWWSRWLGVVQIGSRLSWVALVVVGEREKGKRRDKIMCALLSGVISAPHPTSHLARLHLPICYRRRTGRQAGGTTS